MASSTSSSGTAPVRYAVRQVLDQEYRKETMRKQSDVLNAAGRNSVLGKFPDEQGNLAQKAMKEGAVKRDFFGRIVAAPISENKTSDDHNATDEASKAGRKVWVTYHEGFSNAVRKPISLGELMAGL
ncbi:Chromosome transmission fidelity protein 18 [Penicillium macrosclerotiorum]|uniref:Chromosome transmission fidelity protein 18 n=1 Tax=Penicillium macrosclerotiorum TaxID=303699 RepID=UPI0025466370|nr:Chromosome transmission fidelity protein 18 [Penicillium macrosclerotiorum]KAJ5689623.1 Chromosome transmission fidelity protein 18 [Penicillium macrosclerotiorum]